MTDSKEILMIVITAASGKLGRAVASALSERLPASGIRLLARTPAKLEEYAARGASVVAADYDAPASLAGAFSAGDTVLLISSHGVNEVRLRHHRAAIDAAKAAGVGRIVYTSATHPVPDSRFEWAAAHADTEAYLQASGIPWTILRNNSYLSNLDGLLGQARATGQLGFPGIDAKVAYVSHEDVAAAAVGALIGDGHANRTYEIAGQEAVSARELAALLSARSATSIAAVEVPVAAFADQFRAMGLPEWVATGVASFFAALGAGEYAATSDAVEELSGRRSTSAAEYLETAG
jgi:NAD(P)H dehydrogenase (quinone)